MCEERQRNVSYRAQTFRATQVQLNMKGATVRAAPRHLTSHDSVVDDQFFSAWRFVMERLAAFLSIMTHGEQRINGPELFCDDTGEPTESVVMRRTVDALIRAAAAKCGRE